MLVYSDSEVQRDVSTKEDYSPPRGASGSVTRVMKSVGLPSWTRKTRGLAPLRYWLP